MYRERGGGRRKGERDRERGKGQREGERERGEVTKIGRERQGEGGRERGKEGETDRQTDTQTPKHVKVRKQTTCSFFCACMARNLRLAFFCHLKKDILFSFFNLLCVLKTVNGRISVYHFP